MCICKSLLSKSPRTVGPPARFLYAADLSWFNFFDYKFGETRLVYLVTFPPPIAMLNSVDTALYCIASVFCLLRLLT